MTSIFVAVVVVAFCGAVGILGYFAHMCVCLLQTEVECMKTVAARQEEKAKRINRAARKVEKLGEEAGETPTENTVSEEEPGDSFGCASQGSWS